MALEFTEPRVLVEQAKALATRLATKEPGIFKTLKQTWFRPMANALVSETG